MQKQITDSNIHLYLGLTRTELKKRLSMGLIDPHLLTQQLNDYSDEIKLDALCEQWIENHAVDQVSRDSVDFTESTSTERNLEKVSIETA